jgi:hypothetical protein
MVDEGHVSTYIQVNRERQSRVYSILNGCFVSSSTETVYACPASPWPLTCPSVALCMCVEVRPHICGDSGCGNVNTRWRFMLC